ncbi:MAG: MMPL family transporter [Legionellaceae bacterium]|nr:MMPL family transporter [Legionellaceae bacterium]
MQSKRFFRLGKFVYRFRVAIIVFWILTIIAAVPFISDVISPFQSTGFVAEGSKSDVADDFMNKELGYGHNQFLIMYHSDTLLATESAFQRKVNYSLAALKNLPVEYDLILPKDNEKQISKDKHTAYVVILFKTNKTLSHELIDTFQSVIKKPKQMTMQLGGEPIFVEHINEQTQRDLFNADLIAVPVTIITLLLIFGTVVAALVPMCLGGSCALLILTTLYGLGHLFTLSIFTLNIALLLGLCLSLDYSLFIIYRFRDELNHDLPIEEIIAKTMATAGKAVFFSGVAVFISLSALLFFPINILFSIGVGGLVAVFVAVSVALTLLPAILGALGHKIDTWAVRSIAQQSNDPNVKNTKNLWYKIAYRVVKRPILFSLSTLLFLFILGYTVVNVKVGISDFHVLPDHSDNQQFFDTYKANFNEQELNPIQVIVTANKGNILSKQHIATLYRFVHKLQPNPLIDEVNSIVSIDKTLKKSQYQALYHLKKQDRDKNIQLLLNRTTRYHFTVIDVISNYPPDSKQTKELINELRNIKPGKGLTLQLTGMPVINMDVLDCIKHIIPYAAIWIITLTYLILMVLLRSLFLPFKAIFMNMLSLCASYGVLVFIFQEGHFHEFLHFKTQGMLDVSLIIIIFCALFGFSMDYEVFLLTRIHEAYNTTHDNEKSIIFGIVKSSRIITSAALIVIVLCGSFMIADVLMVKEFGLGVAVAIFVDAFAIRILLVPATMALVKEWNWYLPKWLDKKLPY